MSQKMISISDFCLYFEDFKLERSIEARQNHFIATKGSDPQKYFIHFYNAGSHNFFKKFLRNIENRVSASHPAILPLTGFSKTEDQKYVLIEPYLENDSLHKLVSELKRGKTVPNFETIRSIIIFGVAAGMAYLNQIGIALNNLSPANILLDKDMHPKINNFQESFRYGQSVLEDLDIIEDVVIPPPIYVSPEALTNEEALTKKVDVFTFAIILYEMFKFQNPWPIGRLKNNYKIIKYIIDGNRPEFNKDEIPEIWQNLIERCWKNDPQERPHFIEIVKKLMDKRDKFFDDPKINKDELNRYIDEVTRELDFSRI